MRTYCKFKSKSVSTTLACVLILIPDFKLPLVTPEVIIETGTPTSKGCSYNVSSISIDLPQRLLMDGLLCNVLKKASACLAPVHTWECR